MNAAFFHISLVHIPVVLTPIGCLLLVLGHLRHSIALARVALGLLIAASIMAVVVFLLGEPAEEIIEHLPGVSEHLIEEHEEAAELALWSSVAVGILSLITWWAVSIGAALERLLLAATFILSFVASVTLAYTAHQGGKIRHPEIMSDFKAPK